MKKRKKKIKLTKTINVQKYASEEGKIPRTKLLLKTIKKFGYKTSIDDYIGKIEEAISPFFLDKFIQEFRKRRMTGLYELGVDPSSMIGYGIVKLTTEKCGFYISRVNLKWRSEPEIRMIIEDEDEFKVLWLHNYVRILKKGEFDIVDLERGK